jgi:hypothetical protein
MLFEFQLGEVQLWCSSPRCIRRLMERGARLVDPARADELRRVLGWTRPPAEPTSSTEREPCQSA